MDHTRKMVLIPEQILNDLKRKQSASYSPVKNEIYNLESEMEDVMKRTELSAAERLQLFSELQGRYLKLVKKPDPTPVTIVQPPSALTPDVSHKPSMTVENGDHIEQMIVNSAPARLKSKAQAIVEILKRNPQILSWNDAGQMVYNNKVYEGSNITDLVNDLLVVRKKYKPIGLESFLEGLKRINLPLTNVSNNSRRVAIEQLNTQGMPTMTTKRRLDSTGDEDEIPAKTQKASPVAEHQSDDTMESPKLDSSRIKRLRKLYNTY